MNRPLDYRARDAEALLASMLAVARRTMPEWTTPDDEADVGTVLLEAFAHVGDILGYYVDAAASESFLSSAQSRDSVVEHLRLIGYELGTATPARTELVLAPQAPLATPWTVSTGAAFTTTSRPGRPGVRFEYTGLGDLTLPAGGTTPPALTVPVAEGRTVRDEVLGISDGTPFQRFRLLHPDILLRPVGTSPRTAPDLQVTSAPPAPAPPTRWGRGETLAFTGPDPHVVAVEIGADGRAEVVFGATVPGAGDEVRATYRIGGGAAGNVAAGEITTVVDPGFPASHVTITQGRPARGGAEPEATDHAVAAGPQLFRSLGRAVTAGDYEALAARVPGVGKVRASATDDRTVTLHVAQAGGEPLGDVVTGDVHSFLEDRRPVGTRVEVLDVVYLPVSVTAEVFAAPQRNVDALAARVRAAVEDVLAFDRVDFGQVLYLSKFYEVIEEIDGVDGVTVHRFALPALDATVTGRLRAEGPQLFRMADDGPLLEVRES